MTELTRRDLIRSGAAGALGLWLPFATDARSATWHARAANTRVPRRALAELRRALHGRLLLPGDPGYDAASAPANFRYDSIRPIAVARCRGEADVITCVHWSRAHRVEPVARGGGHSYAGYSTTEGLLVDIGELNDVSVDHHSGRAVMAGAALNQNVLDKTVDGNFVLPGGTCLAVGVGGLTLGGGIGYNTHWGGLTADHLQSTRIVTAQGQVLHVDPKHHPDLFWACRGGAGGNFGINTQFTFQMPEIPSREVAFYRFDWRGADAAAAALRAFDRLLQRDTRGFNAVAMAQASPVGAGGPREAINVFSRGQFLGTQDELERYVQPLVDAAGPPVKRTLTTLKYWDMQRMFAGAEGIRHSFGDISRYSKMPLPDETYAKIADLLADCPSRTPESNGSMWSLGWIGGPVVRRFGRRETAYVHRDMLTLLRATPVWASDAPKSVQNELVAWTDQMIRLVAPHTPAESYQNFPNRGIHNWQRQYYAENFARLVAVKTKYDPHNLFHNAQSIPARSVHAPKLAVPAVAG